MSHIIKSVGSIVKPVASIAAAATGNPELIPLINGGVDLASGKSIGNTLKDTLPSLAISQGLGALGNAFPQTLGFLGTGGNTLTDALGMTKGAGTFSGGLSSIKDLFSAAPTVGSAASNSELFSPSGILTGGDSSSPLSSVADSLNPSGSSGFNYLSPSVAKTFSPDSISTADPFAAASTDAFSNAAGTAASTDNNGVLGNILNKITNNPASSLMTAAQLATYVNGIKNQNLLQTQQQKAAQTSAANNQKFITALNSGPLNRTQTNAPQDYYHYGERTNNPLFYDNVNPKMNFAKGGKVPADPAASIKGQADTVKANLSKGEYVIPADVVSSLGDGNSDAGGKALDAMLANVRKQKAPAMKKGVLPPKAKSPLAYIGA